MQRRRFLQSLSLATAGLVTAQTSHCDPDRRWQIPATKNQAWDKVTDILVVGSGSAGISAAIDARITGVNVLVLEKFHRLSGSSGMSGGVCYLGGGTPLQKACGFSDTVEDMYHFIAGAGRKHPFQEKIQRYCEDSLDHFDWLQKQGVPYQHKYSAIKGLPADDSSLYYSGCEQSFPYNEMARPAPRGHVPAAPGRHSWTGGKLLMEKLTSSALKAGIQIQNRTQVKKLITASDGSVIGVIATHKNKEVAIRAKRGVILTAGGFIHNREMVQRYAPELYDCSVPWGNAGDLGEGILMGMAAGGCAIRMDQGFSIMPLYQPDHVLNGIVINGSGQRFCNEDVYHAVLGHEMAFNQHGKAYLITDSTSAYGYEDYRVKPMATKSTITELANTIGLPTGALEHTLQFYNEFASKGQDPLFRKNSKYLRAVNKAPYTAYDLNPATAFYAAHTFGGLHTSIDGEVLNASNQPVPGLYAAGRTTAGLPSSPYIASGISIGDCTYFGRRAGRAAASRKA